MYLKYRIVECITSSVSQYESYRDQVYRYTPMCNTSFYKFYSWISQFISLFIGFHSFFIIQFFYHSQKFMISMA